MSDDHDVVEVERATVERPFAMKEDHVKVLGWEGKGEGGKERVLR